MSHIFKLFVLQSLLILEVITAGPKFRILAPQFICPKDENTPIEKPDVTVVTIQTAAGSNFDMEWIVRWTPLPQPTQRFTLMIWKTVRALEAKLNKPQPVPFVYLIENDELLKGVDYIFTVNAIDNGVAGTSRVFRIDNSQGDQKLGLIEGRSDLISVILLGGQSTFADVGYTLEAEVTACFATQDYYFIWTVKDTESEDTVDVSHISGSRLEIPPNVLRAGTEYHARCEVMKPSTGLRITQSALDFNVLKRGLKVYLSVDHLVVSMNHAFFMEGAVINHDYYGNSVSFDFKCTYKEEECNGFEIITDNDTIIISTSGLSKGWYKITLTVNTFEHTALAEATINVVEPTLPVIEISLVPRLLNEGTTLTLVANATNVAPTCTLTWYFATEEYLANSEFVTNSTTEEYQHGEALTDTITIFSMQETFLNELIDFTNETEWRQITAQAPAKSGRARFLAKCGCSLTFECSTLGMVYADVKFEFNPGPKANDVLIYPDTGKAMETVFRLSTVAVVDPDGPLTYSFYCRIGSENYSLLLGSHSEHFAVETMLPFVEGGTEIWVEVCDVLGACSKSESKVLNLQQGEATTLDTLAEATRAHARRCEIILLQRVALSAIVTYKSTSQEDALLKFTSELQKSLRLITEVCIDTHFGTYTEFLNKLTQYGIAVGR